MLHTEVNPAPARNPSTRATSKPLAQIEDALVALLNKLLAERKRQSRAPGPKPPLRAISGAELAAMPILSDREIWQKRIIDRPITGALEWAISEIGEVLFLRGGTDLMREILERVARRHPKTYGQRATILDHKWDGIGNKWFC